MNMINKKGVSTVVVTVLLILITIAAVVLLANAIIPFVKNNLAKSSECLDYKDYFKFQEVMSFNGADYRFNCYNDSGYYGFSIMNQGSGKSGSGTPAGFAIVFSDGKTTKRMDIKDGDSVGDVRMLGSSLTKIIVPELGGIQTYVYNSGGESYNSMEVYPLLENGRICDKSDSIGIIKCGTSIKLDVK